MDTALISSSSGAKLIRKPIKATTTPSNMILSKQPAAMGANWCLMLLLVSSFVLISQAQDLLRNTATNLISQQQQQQQQQHQQQMQADANNHNNNLLNNNLLANFQLPPQLASLTPQQLHQLAQIREFQLQQEAAAANRQKLHQQSQDSDQMSSNEQLVLTNSNPEAPAPLGLENAASIRPTERPAGNLIADQIPQPNVATTASSGNQQHQAADSSDRHDSDDGAYTESGSEMEGVSASSGSLAPGGGNSGNSNSSASAAAAPTFEVNWNKCPQLEPSESEKGKKTLVITKCLQAAPIPSNLTRENVEAHREQIATCALKIEGWFDSDGSYKYEKAEQEIRAKKLEPTIENQVLKFHVACKDEANKKFPRDQNKSLIDQVQFYQACMDYYISIVCEIEVSVDQ